MPRPLFALVESDDLQRACTIDAVSRLGFDCLHLRAVQDLVDALKKGVAPQAIGIAVHRYSGDGLQNLRATCRTVSTLTSTPVIFMAHYTEIAPIRAVLIEVLLTMAAADIICTPVVEEELHFRLELQRARRAR